MINHLVFLNHDMFKKEKWSQIANVLKAVFHKSTKGTENQCFHTEPHFFIQLWDL